MNDNLGVFALIKHLTIMLGIIIAIWSLSLPRDNANALLSYTLVAGLLIYILTTITENIIKLWNKPTRE